MNTKMRALALGVLTLSALACDAKAGDDYEGESLLSLQGKVLIEGGDVPSILVPALAFDGPDSAIYYVDVAVRGEFPANFRIDVLTPPPDAVITNKPGDENALPGNPPFAEGDITAVAPDHPARLAHAERATSDFWCEASTGGDPAAHAPHSGRTVEQADASSVCFRERNACTQGRTSCYHALLRCDPTFAQCVTLEERGDAFLWAGRYYAGKSLNYKVIYLAAEARAGSFLSQMFGAGRVLSPGYHLIAVKPVDPARDEQSYACTLRAQDLLQQRYAQKLGRAIATEAELYDEARLAKYNEVAQTSFPDWAALTRSVAREQIDTVTSDVSEALSLARLQIEVELQCVSLRTVTEAVGPADARDIEVRIGPPEPLATERVPFPPPILTSRSPT